MCVCVHVCVCACMCVGVVLQIRNSLLILYKQQFWIVQV